MKKETFNSKRGLKEVQLKDPNICGNYKEVGCVKDVCDCYTLVSKEETLQEIKLLSMTEFVLEEGNPSNTDCQFADKVMAYANFLKQPLELWMFVPCDKDGSVVEKPECSLDKECASPTCVKYQQAKERVLFEGFEVRKMKGWNILDFPNNQYSKDFSVFEDAFKELTIEDLIKYNLTLTPTAIKQIGL